MADENVKQDGVGLPAGTKIGKYEISLRLKIGGQAIVYKAHDSLLGRDVAIKQISTHLAEDAAFLERFRREAQILARLGQEQAAIVTVHELIENERGLFMVMEFVSGKNLQTVLEESAGPMDVKAALQIIWRLAGALHSVHAAGIIHRDIKPANIMIGEGLRVKIADFGVAASISGQTSMLFGTTKYMAPELFSCEGPVDGRVDMYSLGFIAYEMLAGRQKFKEVFSEVVRDPHTESLRWMKWHSDKHVEAPALNEVNSGVPEALGGIVARMMAKDPNERYESMEALGRDIKGHFSSRMRAESVAAAAAPPVGQLAEEQLQAPPAGAAEPAEKPPAAAEDLLSEGPATAELPKRAMPLKTKLIAAAAALVVLLGAVLGFSIYRRWQDRQQRSSTEWMFIQAWRAYDTDGDYKEAQEKFQELLASFPQTDQAAKASVILHLCEAHLAVSDHDWQAAQQHEKTAVERLNNVQRDAVAGSLLDRWTEQFKDDIERFKDYRIAAWDFRNRLARAEELLDESRFKEALDELRKFKRSAAALTESLRTELREFCAKVELAKFRSECSSEISKGDGLVTEGKLQEAKVAYQNAKTMLEDKQGRVLPKEEREKLLLRLAANLKSVETRGRYEDAIAAADEARRDGDKVGEMGPLRQAYEIKPSAELEARIKSLRSQIDLERARDLIDKGNRAQAMEVLENLLEYAPGNGDASALLKALQQRAKWRVVLNEAHGLFRRREYTQALAKYDQAAAINPPDPSVKERMTDCRYNIQMDEADNLRREGKFREAIAALEKARAIKPARGSTISAKQEQLIREMQYRDNLAAGDLAQQNKNWNGALAEYRKAQRIKNGPEIKARIAITKYSRFVERGRASLKDADPVSARAYFNRAREVMDTEEIRKLIAHADKLIEALR